MLMYKFTYKCSVLSGFLVMSLNDTSDDSMPAFCLCDLPVHILELIGKFLVHETSPLRLARNSFNLRSSISHLMNLRATCIYLNGIIKNMMLKLDCEISLDWFDSPYMERSEDIFRLIEFIRTRTNWRIKSLRIDPHLNLDKRDVLSILRENELLFCKNLTNLFLPLPRTDQSFIDNICEWLITTAFTEEPNISLNWCSREVSFPYPELVSLLQFHDSDSNFFLSDSSLRAISSFSNLTVLDMPYLNCAVEQLKCLPNLKVISVAGLYQSNLEDNAKFLKFPNIERLYLCSPEDEYFHNLPNIIRLCFPSIVCFGIYGNLAVSEDSAIDFSGLPSSCKILITELMYSGYFSGCKSVEKINIFFRDGSLDLLNNFLLSALNIKFLKISFGNFSLHSSELLPIVLFILNGFTSLEVLCLDAVLLSDTYEVHEESDLCSIFVKILKGDKCFDSNSFFREQSEMRRLCRKNGNLKVLSLGKTCFVKKMVGAALFREIDNLDMELCWDMRPRDCVVLPLELLTD